MRKITTICLLLILTVGVMAQTNSEMPSWLEDEAFTEDDRTDLSTQFYEAGLEALQKYSSMSNTADYKAAYSLLTAKALPFKAGELSNGFNKVRSIQFDCAAGVVSYPFFPCRIYWEGPRYLWFDKTRGSQRKVFSFYKCFGDYLAVSGIYYFGGEAKVWDEKHHVVGLAKKVSANKFVILFSDEYGYELYEIVKGK